MYYIRRIFFKVLLRRCFPLLYRMAAEKKRSEKYPDIAEVLRRTGKRMKTLRVSKGHPNYEKFAFTHDISRSQLWRYENGEDLKLSSLIRVLNALDISLHDFFSEGFEGPMAGDAEE